MPAKKTSPWIAHVKQYSKSNNCSYGDALKRFALLSMVKAADS